jgi:hypothetical protein
LYTSFLRSYLIAGDIHSRRKVCGGVALLPYKVYKLILFRGKRRAVLVCPVSAVIVGGLKSSIVLSYRVSLSNKVYIVYEAKP